MSGHVVSLFDYDLSSLDIRESCYQKLSSVVSLAVGGTDLQCRKS
jgi:hypothetical protein